MTEPYRRETVSEVAFVHGQIDLHAAGRHVHATLRRGEAEVILLEEIDDAITAWGLTEPVRYVNERRRIRIVVEADLADLVLKVD